MPTNSKKSKRPAGFAPLGGSDDPWVDWTCPTCLAEMSDPASMKETSCGSGHMAYLGKVHESPTGYSRRAYKTRGERSREQRKERMMHDTYMTIMSGAFANHQNS